MNVDLERRPWAEPEELLIPDLLMRSVRMITPPDLRTTSTDIQYNHLMQRYVTLNEDLEAIIDVTIPNFTRDVYPKENSHKIKNKKELVEAIAAWMTDDMIDYLNCELAQRKSWLTSMYGKESVKKWEKDWERCVEELKAIQRLPKGGHFRTKPARGNILRKLTELEKQEVRLEIDFPILKWTNPRGKGSICTREPNYGRPIIIKKLKTYHEILYKAAIDIISRMTDEDAARIHSKIKHLYKQPEKCVDFFAPFCYDIVLGDTAGLRFVLPSIEATRDMAGTYRNILRQHGISHQIRGRSVMIEEAAQRGEKMYENYIENPKKGRLLPAISLELNPPHASQWREEDPFIPWGFSNITKVKEELVEEKDKLVEEFPAIFSGYSRWRDTTEFQCYPMALFLMENMGETRIDHGRYKNRKGWKQNTEWPLTTNDKTPKKPWSDNHYDVHRILYDAMTTAWRNQNTPGFMRAASFNPRS